MKLPDFTLSPDLNDLKIRMGMRADQFGSFLVTVAPARLTEEELGKLRSTKGLDVNFEDLTILSDSTFAYKNSRVLLYIRDVPSVTSEPKFHLSDCHAIDKLRKNGKFNRYVISIRTDGVFALNLVNERPIVTMDKKLAVCRYCLDSLHYKGYSSGLPEAEKTHRVAGFDLKEFFTLYPRDLHSQRPDHTSQSAPVNTYRPQFPETRDDVRTARKWTCEDCGVNLSAQSDRKYLHVHHVNGVRYDDRDSNLRVLCIGCHADQPNHAHMKNSPQYKEYKARH